MPIQSIAVFCGSKEGANPLFRQHADELATILATNGITLIYGGGRNGLMGAVADGVMNQGGTVRGVIPQVLIDWEHQHLGISELLVVEDMHVRKRKLYELSDAVIILPGGFGTLDELFETLTWNQLSIHDKKIFILNTAGFYDHLMLHLKHLGNEGFLYGDLEENITVLNTPADIVSFLS